MAFKTRIRVVRDGGLSLCEHDRGRFLAIEEEIYRLATSALFGRAIDVRRGTTTRASEARQTVRGPLKQRELMP
jgi:hypothetical protein